MHEEPGRLAVTVTITLLGAAYMFKNEVEEQRCTPCLSCSLRKKGFQRIRGLLWILQRCVRIAENNQEFVNTP